MCLRLHRRPSRRKSLAARLLAKDKWFTAVAALALALGIGVNTTVFTFANAIVLRGLPFAGRRFDHLDRDDRALAFGLPINKDVVRRILAVRYRPAPDSAGPSWFTVLGDAKDSLWSLDLFRCESTVLRTHWVLVVMDQCTRVASWGLPSIAALLMACRCAGCSIERLEAKPSPKHRSSDHDPLYRFHQWQANLRIL
jgi:hypothetical protein